MRLHTAYAAVVLIVLVIVIVVVFWLMMLRAGDDDCPFRCAQCDFLLCLLLQLFVFHFICFRTVLMMMRLLLSLLLLSFLLSNQNNRRFLLLMIPLNFCCDLTASIQHQTCECVCAYVCICHSPRAQHELKVCKSLQKHTSPANERLCLCDCKHVSMECGYLKQYLSFILYKYVSLNSLTNVGKDELRHNKYNKKSKIRK